MNSVILNPMGIKKEADNSDFSSKFVQVGGNTGNLIFYNAVKEQISFLREIDINSNIDSSVKMVVIPCSNFIQNGGNDSFYEGFLNFLDRTKCKITLIGLGAQSSTFCDTPKKLMEEGVLKSKIKVAFFRRLAERSKTIGVRGEFTAKCLEILGINNVRIIGCPSFFSYFDGVFPEMPSPSAKRVQMSITPARFAPLQTKLLQMGIRENAYWVMQSENEIPYYRHGFLNPNYRLTRFFGLCTSTKKIKKYINERGKLFFSYDEWNKFYKNEKITFAYGSRFHGNMAALRNGIPALWVVHDSRTRELVETINLPHIELESVCRVKSINQLINYCDYSETRKKYKDLCKKYIDFLEENELDHNFSLFDKGK